MEDHKLFLKLFSAAGAARFGLETVITDLFESLPTTDVAGPILATSFTAIGILKQYYR